MNPKNKQSYAESGKATRKKVVMILELSELDVRILLEALGEHQNKLFNMRLNTQATQYLVDRVYKGMGVEL